MLRNIKNVRNLSPLSLLGIKKNNNILYNVCYNRINELYKERCEVVNLKTKYEKVSNIDTCTYTDRPLPDRWLVTKNETYKNIWWGSINKRMSLDVFDKLSDCSGDRRAGCYQLNNISYLKQDSSGLHPKNIIFLTWDAYGVLPPISRLSHGQAMYHFLSGYTSKIGVTERGINKPDATFSTAFGDSFFPLHPSKYADLLQEKLKKHKSQVWLINTGWSGGQYGDGKQIDIDITIKCINAIIENKIDSEYLIHPHFGFEIPKNVENVDSNILNPINTWNTIWNYNLTCYTLVNYFKENHKQFSDKSYTDYSQYGPEMNSF